jgi:hypothetical protein
LLMQQERIGQVSELGTIAHNWVMFHVEHPTVRAGRACVC